MSKLTLADFASATQNHKLATAAPLVKHIAPEDLMALWQQMPAGSLPKEQIFAGAVALAVAHMQNEMRHANTRSEITQ